MSLRKGVIILLVAVVFIASLAVYRLYSIKKVLLTFSGNGLIVGDGIGSYEDGVQGVHTGFTRSGGIFLDLNESSRFLYIKFEYAYWKDDTLRDIPPLLPSKNYRVILGIQVSEKSITDMSIGESLEPDVAVLLYDGETGELIGSIARMLTSNTVYLSSSWMVVQPPPQPPMVLYQDGHLRLTRTGSDTWVLEGAAWFSLRLSSKDMGSRPPTYYVKLSLEITVNLKSLV